MSTLNDLLRQVAVHDAQLAADLGQEFKALSERRAFGLNFERHRPETVELPGTPVRRGDKVRVREGDRRLWRVAAVTRDVDIKIAKLEPLDAPGEGQSRPVDELVVVAEFRDPIYPGLVSTGTVERGSDKPHHVVINAENYHALQALLFTHEGKVDAIYIDPPYNTGARDWKYNNDYVDGDDAYRHSKWLAMMERRLLLAKRLLNPENSVLIVTIDEKEYLRLGLLLEQAFPDGRITMVSSAISAASTRSGTFGRAAEYLYFVQLGASAPVPLALPSEWNPVGTKNKSDIRWSLLMRSGTQPFRTTHPNLFYPVYVRLGSDGPEFHSVGQPFYGDGWEAQTAPSGAFAIWPIRQDGREGRWQISPGALQKLIETGMARLGRWSEGATTVYYLKAGEQKKVASGEFAISGRRSDGSIVTDGSGYEARFVPTDMWRITSHDAGNSGSRILDRLIPGRRFPFPKSLYAVEDALRFFVADKPDAGIVDFFAGSGTTAHAVMRLNRQDGGRRTSISITNNEVSADEQANLRARGLHPGDREWEALGICDYITKPRIRAAITGRTPDGESIKGEYKFTDEFPMADGFEENVEFFTMTYETRLRVAHNRAFESVAPLLWLKAGARGRRIDKATDTYAVGDSYSILFNLDASRQFLEAIAAAPAVALAFVITDDERSYQMICAELPAHVTPERLHESYLTNFTLNVGDR